MKKLNSNHLKIIAIIAMTIGRIGEPKDIAMLIFS